MKAEVQIRRIHKPVPSDDNGTITIDHPRPRRARKVDVMLIAGCHQFELDCAILSVGPVPRRGLVHE